MKPCKIFGASSLVQRFFLTCLALWATLVFASGPDTLWTRTYGGSGYDGGQTIAQTSDGGYIIAGITGSFGAGSNDVWLIKTDANGDTLWTKTFGGTLVDEAYAVTQTSDSGYIIAGWTMSFGNPDDIYLIKTDINGDSLWTKTYGTAGYEYSYAVKQTSDSGYIITGATSSFGAGGGDVWLIKTDANGDTLWTKTFGGTDLDIGRAVEQTADGGYIIAGETMSFGAGNADAWLIKTDANGDSLWTKTFGSAFGEMAYAVEQTIDGGYILTGAGAGDVFLIKTDENGARLWTKIFGGGLDDAGSAVQQTSDGGYIIIGATYSFGAGVYDIWIIKTDPNGDSIWTQTYGGSSNDYGYSGKATADGGYVITGYTSSFGAGGGDVYLIKTEPGEYAPWTNTYGGTNDDGAYAVAQTLDAGFVATGYTSSFGAGNKDIYLVKTYGSGDSVWTRTYGSSADDQGNAIKQTADTGYVIAGYTASIVGRGKDAYLIKTDANGDTIWTKTFGGANDDWASAIEPTNDGGYIICGQTSSFGSGGNDVYLVKTEADGDTVWTNAYGGASEDCGYAVAQTSDGGYIICGLTSSSGNGGDDVYLIKTNGAGDTSWTRTYGGIDDDGGYAMAQTSDGGYIIAGYTNTYGVGMSDVYVVKTDSNGNPLWTQTYGGANDDYGYAITPITAGGYIVAGYTSSFGTGNADVWVIAIDENGDTTWTQTFGGTSDDLGYAIEQTLEGGYIVCGTTASFGTGGIDCWLIKIQSSPYAGTNENNTVRKYLNASSLEIYPNPFREKIQIKYALSSKHYAEGNDVPTAYSLVPTIKIYDVTGRLVKDLMLPTAYSPGLAPQGGAGLLPTSLTWDGTDDNGKKLPAGIYFARLATPEQSLTNKIIKLR